MDKKSHFMKHSLIYRHNSSLSTTWWEKLRPQHLKLKFDTQIDYIPYQDKSCKRIEKKRVKMTSSIKRTIIGTILYIFYTHNLKAVYCQ